MRLDVFENSDRQSRRDRVPDHAYGQTHGIAHGGGLFRRRSRCHARRARRRGAAHRPGAGEGQLPSHRRYHRRGADDGRRGDPSRLRLSLRERRFCASLRGCGLGFRRAFRRDHPPDGLEISGEGADGVGRGAGRARLSRRGSEHGDAASRRRSHRLSGSGQGVGGRRRQRHAPGRQRRGARRSDRQRQTRSGGLVWE